jgi:penicillin G amidase
VLRLFVLFWLPVLVAFGLGLVTGFKLFHLLTVLLVVTNVGLYLYFRRSLPHRRGSVRLPGLHEQVEVFFDDHGVPHIYANNTHDLYMAQGYVTAQDRLWSMDFHRRLASGRLAELFGTRSLSMDKHFRTVGLRRAAVSSFATCSPATQEVLRAYAAGVNAHIAERRLSPEFTVLGCRPEPWTPQDTLLIGKFAAYALGGNWDRELFRAQLVQALGADKAAELFWLPPDDSVLHTLEQTPLPPVDDLLDIAAATSYESSGGNAWAVSGSKTRSGAPLLANDPHLAVGNPGPWYETHLVGTDGLDVAGVTFPGVPGVILGQNREIAWGMSNLNIDTEDVFIERVNPAAPDEFLYEGQWEKASRLEERIRVRWVAQPVVHEVLVTRHGPVIAAEGPTAFSLQWTALEPSVEVETFLAINRARNWGEFRQALSTYASPVQHFVFAGRDGTVAWRPAGKIPVRPRGDGQAPVPGWTADYAWTSTVDFADLPESVNPPEGFVTPKNYAFSDGCHSTADSLPPYRAQWIAERLQAGSGWTVAGLQQLQNDCVNNHARALLQLLLNSVQEGLRQGPHPETLNDIEKRALLMLSGWNCCEGADAPEPALWHHWYLFLLEGIFRPQMGLALYDRFVASGMPTQVTDRLLRQVAEGGDSLWLSREGEGSLGRVALRSFKRAVGLVAAKQGKRMENWRWGKERTIAFEHPLARTARLFKPFLSLGPFGIGGSAITVDNQGFSQLNPFRATVAATWRQTVDLGDRDESQSINAPGQTGHPLSPHYADQLAAWLKGESHPQLLRHKQIQTLPPLLLRPD